MKPSLYIHAKAARHFLGWEIPNFRKWFEIVDAPSSNTALLAVGPDAMGEATSLPASHRFLVQYPGFGHNPLHDLEVRRQDLKLFASEYELVFVNPGPLEIAYAECPQLVLYPPCVDTSKFPRFRARDRLDSLLHVSSRTAQKDWQRSAAIMKKSMLRHEVFPPRDERFLRREELRSQRSAHLRGALRIPHESALPFGYVRHSTTIAKYRAYDGFVHVAKDVKHPTMLDGKYTATVMEAALTGALIFWHDTLNLGNTFETVFDMPINTDLSAELIRDVRSSVDIRRHSELTREEFIEKVAPEKSVELRSTAMLEIID